MIGRFHTVHPNEGYGIIVGYRRIDRVITITSITDRSGKNVWGQMTSGTIQRLKSEIPK